MPPLASLRSAVPPKFLLRKNGGTRTAFFLGLTSVVSALVLVSACGSSSTTNSQFGDSGSSPEAQTCSDFDAASFQPTCSPLDGDIGCSTADLHYGAPLTAAFYDNGCTVPTSQLSAYGCTPVTCTCNHNPVTCQTDSGFCWTCPL